MRWIRIAFGASAAPCYSSASFSFKIGELLEASADFVACIPRVERALSCVYYPNGESLIPEEASVSVAFLLLRTRVGSHVDVWQQAGFEMQVQVQGHERLMLEGCVEDLPFKSRKLLVVVGKED